MGAPFFGTRTDFLHRLCTGKDLARKKVICSSNSHFAKIEGSDWWIDVNATSYKNTRRTVHKSIPGIVIHKTRSTVHKSIPSKNFCEEG